MNKKINAISTYEVLMCLFVIIAHAMSECITFYPKNSLLYFIFFYVSRSMSVAVSAFILSAGIKFMNKYKKDTFSYLEFLTDRIYKIYIPYIFIVCLYYFYFIFRGNITGFNLTELLKYIISGNLAAPFYFIVIIIQFYILAPIWLFFCRKIHAILGIIIAAAITFTSHYFLKADWINYSCISYILYWITGCYIGLNFDKTIAYLRKIKKPMILIGILFTFTYTTFAYMFSVNENTQLTNDAVEITRIIFCLFASLMYLLLMKDRNNKIIGIMSSCTYYVYLIHSLIIFEIDHIMTFWGIELIGYRFIIRLTLTLFISFALALLYVTPKKLLLKK